MRSAVYFDVETAGLADGAPIIQLASVAVDEDTWEELGTFNALLKFDESKGERGYPCGASRIQVIQFPEPVQVSPTGFEADGQSLHGGEAGRAQR
jgi:hypothetical protein